MGDCAIANFEEFFAERLVSWRSGDAVDKPANSNQLM